MKIKKITHRYVCDCGNRIDVIVMSMRNLSRLSIKGTCDFCGKIVTHQPVNKI